MVDVSKSGLSAIGEGLELVLKVSNNPEEIKKIHIGEVSELWKGINSDILKELPLEEIQNTLYSNKIIGPEAYIKEISKYTQIYIHNKENYKGPEMLKKAYDFCMNHDTIHGKKFKEAYEKKDMKGMLENATEILKTYTPIYEASFKNEIWKALPTKKLEEIVNKEYEKQDKSIMNINITYGILDMLSKYYKEDLKEKNPKLAEQIKKLRKIGKYENEMQLKEELEEVKETAKFG